MSELAAMIGGLENVRKLSEAVPQEIPQLGARSMKLSLGSSNGTVDHLCNLAVLEPLNVVQNENGPAGPGQPRDGPLQIHAIDEARQRNIRTANLSFASSVLRTRFWRFLDWGGQQAFPAQMHKHNIDREAVKPSGECRSSAERVDLSEDSKERLLSQVFGFCRIPQHAQANGVNAPAMQAIEMLKRAGVALLSASDGF
jgi:hypothetical protein